MFSSWFFAVQMARCNVSSDGSPLPPEYSLQASPKDCCPFGSASKPLMRTVGDPGNRSERAAASSVIGIS
jgi:hypothetical protein